MLTSPQELKSSWDPTTAASTRLAYCWQPGVVTPRGNRLLVLSPLCRAPAVVGGRDGEERASSASEVSAGGRCVRCSLEDDRDTGEAESWLLSSRLNCLQ
jgi:hypothetical protein